VYSYSMDRLEIVKVTNQNRRDNRIDLSNSMTTKVPSLIECRRYNSSIISSIGRPEWDSFRLLCQMLDSKSGDKEHNVPSSPSSSDQEISLQPAPRNEIKRRNRTNILSWSDNDVKMFYVRIAPDLFGSNDDNDDSSYQPPPPRLPSCFTEEERRVIEMSCARDETTEDRCTEEGETETPTAGTDINSRPDEDKAETVPIETNKLSLQSRNEKSNNDKQIFQRKKRSHQFTKWMSQKLPLFKHGSSVP